MRKARGTYEKDAEDTAPCIFPPASSYTYTMKLLNELTFDFDITGPRVTASEHAAIVENVLRVVLITDTQVTVHTGRFFVTISGGNFVIGEIWEGRMELEGDIQGIEFHKALG